VSDVAGIIVLVGRILFVIFPAYVSGWSFHVKNAKAAEGYAQAVGFPVPSVAGTVAGAWLIVASISIAVGIFPDIGALMLAAFVAFAAWYFHAFWKLEAGDMKQTQSMSFWRNVMIFASCLVMFAFFTSVGEGLRFSVTDALIDLS
jgi:putative oxidoreductase